MNNSQYSFKPKKWEVRIVKNVKIILALDTGRLMQFQPGNLSSPVDLCQGTPCSVLRQKMVSQGGVVAVLEAPGIQTSCGVRTNRFRIQRPMLRSQSVQTQTKEPNMLPTRTIPLPGLTIQPVSIIVEAMLVEMPQIFFA